MDRPRLRAILDGEAALTVVYGPAGSGKSTLLAQWVGTLDDTRAAIVQASFGARVTNPHTLWHDVLAQLADRADAVADAAALRDDVRGFDSLRDVPTTVGQVLANLTLPCVLLIDNVERADDAALIRELVDLLSRAPLLRVVLATRRALTPRLLQLMADTETAVIGPPLLMFCARETQELIERVSGSPAPPGSVDEAGTLPLSARLTAMAVLAQQWPLGEADAGRASIADALMSRLLDGDVAPAFLEFLQCTSLPSAVTPEVCRLLGWEDGGREHLERAETLGLGMWQAADGSLGFVYTPVLRAALQRRLVSRGTPDVQEMRRTVALWAFSRRHHLEALSLALAAGDHHLASRFARKSWFVLSQTCPEDVIDLLGKQGSVTLARFPVLSTAMALMLVTVGHRLRAFGYLQTAVLRTGVRRDPDEDPIERLWAASLRSLAARLSGRFDRAESAADEVRDIHCSMSPAKRAEIEDTIALQLSSAAMGLFYAGRVEDAVGVLEEGMQVHVPDDDAGWYHCATTLTGIHALEGRLAHARRVIAAIDDAAPPASWRTDFYGVLEQVAHAELALADLDLSRAQSRLDSVAYHLGTSEHWPFVACVQSEIHLLAGRAAEASRSIESAVERGTHPGTSTYALDRLRTTHCLALLAAGDLSAADRVRSLISPGHEATRVLSALRAFLTGRADQAFTALGAIASGAEALRDRHLEFLAGLTFARSALLLARPDPARRALARVVAEIDEQQTIAPLRWLSAGDVPALAAVADPATAEMLQVLLDRMPQLPPVFEPLPSQVTLTARETAVLRELVRTSSTAAIAARLYVSPNTVKVQRRSAYRKLGVGNRADALVRAAELGLLAQDDTRA